MIVERTQPWLGTYVSIRVEGLDAVEAHCAITAAFEHTATVHRLMSFHEAASDVTRLNREGTLRAVTVHPSTFAVLQWAQRFASLSHGCFDISVGAELVEWGLLPSPCGSVTSPSGSWRDIELLPKGQVLFHRPLWIDLGGIAKGYAVDKAIECLLERGAEHCVVNAGGDIRVQGNRTELIRLQVESPGTAAVVELTNGSVASSCGWQRKRCIGGKLRGPHLDGADRTTSWTDRFVCVVADHCVVADALTKVVMAQGAQSANLLRQFGAKAHVFDPGGGWMHLPAREDAG
ncbi:MAG: FAD:protein FMN transferase [Acidobacteria bacterium]|nr:FAD:protein FMN transferase [Acidobacteriota bacterium]MBW4045536.1 FAD:protein FMN transferase [Acidobacteriota bacterium]